MSVRGWSSADKASCPALLTDMFLRLAAPTTIHVHCCWEVVGGAVSRYTAALPIACSQGEFQDLSASLPSDIVSNVWQSVDRVILCACAVRVWCWPVNSAQSGKNKSFPLTSIGFLQLCQCKPGQHLHSTFLGQKKD
jgi:hypothetical protein